MAAIAAIALSVVGALIALDLWISRIAAGGGDFFAAWTSARGFLLSQMLPYGDAAAKSAQQLVYGRAAGSGENPYLSTVPFFLLPIYYPFAAVSVPGTARALWMCLGQLAIAGSAFLVALLTDWRGPRSFVVAYLCVAGLGYYSVAAMLDGSPLLILSLLYSTVIWAYAVRRDELAGALVALCLFQWEIGGPFLLLLGWRILREKRWNILGGLTMALTILLAISFLTYPAWILAFLRATLTALRGSFGVSTTTVLLHLSPQYGAAIAQIMTVMGVGILVYEGAAARDSDVVRLIWMSCLALAVTPLLGVPTDLSHLAVLHPGIALICVACLRRGGQAKWLAVLVLVVALVMPWILFARWSSLHDQRALDLLFLLYPALCIAGLYWTRWWFLHPQGTVLDQARSPIG